MFALTSPPYKGRAVDALYEYLRRNQRKFADPTTRGYYARFCSESRVPEQERRAQ
ncbi:hypothetical protein J3R82DRAFT_3639 [Butyriboletus roseoflavus]|nr:hypothetical protein J3R82DRAFT_3639 [Butyriboletus roseoflavus]